MSKKEKKYKVPFPIGGFNHLVKKDILEMEYLNDLPPELQEYMYRFLDNHSGNYKNDGKDIIKNQKTRRETYKENNKRLQDIYNKSQPCEYSPYIITKK